MPDECILVDNASNEALDEVKANWPRLDRVIRTRRNLGVAGGFNVGINATSGDFIIIITQDVVLQERCLEELVATLRRRPNAAVVGCKLLYPNSRVLQHTGASLSYPLAIPCQRGKGILDFGQFDEESTVPYVTGAVFGIRRSAAISVGGFDESLYPAYFEDSDFCFRVWESGSEVVYVPTAVASHAENSSLRRKSAIHFFSHHSNRLRFILKRIHLPGLAAAFINEERYLVHTIVDPLERRGLLTAYGKLKNDPNLRGLGRDALGAILREIPLLRSTVANADLSTALETNNWCSREPWLDRL